MSGDYTKKNLQYYLLSYIAFCNANNSRPVPQMFKQFQPREKKALLDKIEKRQISMYLPGNDKNCRRRLTDEDLDVLIKFLKAEFPKSVRRLDLRFNNLKNLVKVDELKEMVQELEHLNLMHNDLTDQGICVLKTALVAGQKLVSLCLNGVKLTQLGASEVSNLCGSLKTLKYIGLSHCNLRLEAIISISTLLLEGNSCLEALDITAAHFTSPNSLTVLVDQLSCMLESNETLKELHLGKIGLDDFSLERLMPGLKKNKTLKYLDLLGNKLNRDGARTLMRYLQSNQTLEVLDVDSNAFCDEGAEYLANGIFDNQTLNTLSVRNTKLSDKGLEYLAKGLVHGVVRKIYLWQGQSLSGRGCELLNNLITYGRLTNEDVDFKTQAIDDVWHLAENGRYGLKGFDAFTPDYGEHSHDAYYSGFAEPLPAPYWTPVPLR